MFMRLLTYFKVLKTPNLGIDCQVETFFIDIKDKPVRLSEQTKYAYKVYISCSKDNRESVYIGSSPSVNANSGTLVPRNFIFPIDVLIGGTNGRLDLSQIYITGTNNDQVNVMVIK